MVQDDLHRYINQKFLDSRIIHGNEGEHSKRCPVRASQPLELAENVTTAKSKPGIEFCFENLPIASVSALPICVVITMPSWRSSPAAILSGDARFTRPSACIRPRRHEQRRSTGQEVRYRSASIELARWPIGQG